MINYDELEKNLNVEFLKLKLEHQRYESIINENRNSIMLETLELRLVYEGKIVESIKNFFKKLREFGRKVFRLHFELIKKIMQKFKKSVKTYMTKFEIVRKYLEDPRSLEKRKTEKVDDIGLLNTKLYTLLTTPRGNTIVGKYLNVLEDEIVKFNKDTGRFTANAIFRKDRRPINVDIPVYRSDRGALMGVGYSNLVQHEPSVEPAIDEFIKRVNDRINSIDFKKAEDDIKDHANIVYRKHTYQLDEPELLKSIKELFSGDGIFKKMTFSLNYSHNSYVSACNNLEKVLVSVGSSKLTSLASNLTGAYIKLFNIFFNEAIRLDNEINRDYFRVINNIASIAGKYYKEVQISEFID